MGHIQADCPSKESLSIEGHHRSEQEQEHEHAQQDDQEEQDDDDDETEEDSRAANVRCYNCGNMVCQARNSNSICFVSL